MKANVRWPYYCSVLWNAAGVNESMEYFEFMQRKYMIETENEEKLALLFGLSCVRDMDMMRT